MQSNILDFYDLEKRDVEILPNKKLNVMGLKLAFILDEPVIIKSSAKDFVKLWGYQISSAGLRLVKTENMGSSKSKNGIPSEYK